jgi:phosphoglycerol transferase
MNVGAQLDDARADAPGEAVRDGLSTEVGDAPRASWPVRLAWAVIPPGLLAAGSILLAALLYQPWGNRLSLPLSDGFDLQLHALFIKNLLSTGDYATTSRLGAPFGQNLLDFPISGDRIHLWIFQLIGLFTKNPYTALSVYFLLGFGMVAAVTYAVARELRLDRPVAAFVSLVFTFLPYHFWHDEKHAFLAAYFPVPLGFLLAVWAIRGTLPIPRVVVPKGSWTHEDRRRFVILVICVLVGASSDSYYAMFAVFLVAAGGLLGALGRRSWRTLFAAVLTTGALLFVTIANNIREIIWRSQHGVDHFVAQRPTADSERYALHLAQALLPGSNYRVKGLARIGATARAVASPGEGGMYLGVIAAVGLIVGIGWLLVRGLGRGRDLTGDPADAEMPLPVAAGALGLAVTLIATVGGLGFILAVFGFSQIRSWGRFGLDMSLAGLLCAGWLLQRWKQRATGGWRIAAQAAIPILLVVAFLDQVPASVKPRYASVRRTVESEQAFTNSMEAMLPENAMVFQLPLSTFPEAGPIVNLPDYSLLMPYLLGNGKLRYSFGGLRGRASDWQVPWGTHPTPQLTRGLALVGYDALYVDRRGYVDRGAQLDKDLRPLVGPPVLVSADGNQVLYDLRPLQRDLNARHSPAEQAQLRDLILHSVEARFGPGFGHNDGPDTVIKRWMGPKGTITLQNPLPTPRPVELRLSVKSPTDADVTVDVLGQHQSVRLNRQNDRTHVFKFEVTLPSGNTAVRLTTDARQIPNPISSEDQRVQLTGLVVDDPLVHQATKS